tara:strand:- start:906 stop:1256 length:351 start_codon:yes stop_codon:yes gene_type:complete
MFAVFSLCILVQYNDPDSFLWMAMYGSAAIACIVVERDMITHWTITIFPGVAGLVWVLTLLPDVVSNDSSVEDLVTWKMNSLGVEQVRELGGLIIIVLWMLTLTAINYWNKNKLNN